MRNSITIATVAFVVAAVLIGGWFVFSPRGSTTASASGSGPAPTTELAWPSYRSTSTPVPYPTIPSEQVRPASENDHAPTGMRTGHDGRQLLIPLTESECVSEEFWLLGEYPDRVEVEVRFLSKPPPSGVSVAPDGSYGCMGTSGGSGTGPHAAIELAAPLGARTVVIRQAKS